MKKTKKDKKPTKAEQNILQAFKEKGGDLDFVERIMPRGGIRFYDGYIETGTGIETTITISDFPNHLDVFWLFDICRNIGQLTFLDVSPLDGEYLREEINKGIQEMHDRSIYEKKAIDRDVASLNKEELRYLAETLNRNKEVMLNAQIRIVLHGRTRKSLPEQVENTMSMLEAEGYHLQINLGESFEDWRNRFSFEINEEKCFSHRKGQPLESEALGAGVAIHHVGLDDDGGLYLGSSKTNGSIKFNWFLNDGGMRSYYNGMAIGAPGVGKSTFMKKLIKSNYLCNNYIRGFSLEGEYKDLCEYLGGEMLDLSGRDGIINILEVFGIRSFEDGETDEVSSYKAHISKVATIFNYLKDDQEYISENTISVLLDMFYIEKGLWNEEQTMKITGKRSEEYPILSDFKVFVEDVYEKINDRNEQQEIYSIIKILRTMTGLHKDVWDGITTFPNLLDEQVVFYEIARAKEMGEKFFQAQLFNCMTTIWNTTMINGRKMKHLWETRKNDLNFSESNIRNTFVVIDECHNILNPKNPFAVEMVVKFQREMRKFFGGILFATQSAQELFPEGVQGEAIANLKKIFEFLNFKFLFRQDESVIELLKKVLGSSLSESMYELIPTLGSNHEKGDMIMTVAGKQAMRVKVEITEKEDEIFAGGR